MNNVSRISEHPPLQWGSWHLDPANSCLPRIGPNFQTFWLFKRNLKPGHFIWNVPIFKKLAQLFLKHYVGQQNMSVGCQFVTLVLKQDHCSLNVSHYLAFANTLPGTAVERFSTLEFSNPGICSMSLNLGLSYSFASWDLGSLTLPGTLL